MMKVLLPLFFLLNVIATSCFGQMAHSDERFNTIARYKSTQPDTAFFIAKTCYLKAQKSNNYSLKADYALALGEILYYLGDFENANRYIVEAANYYEENDIKEKLAETYKWRGIVIQYARQFPMAITAYDKALAIYQELGEPLKIGEMYGWIGHYYEKTGRSDTALIFQYKAQKIISSQQMDHPFLAKIYDNLGSIYEDQMQYDSANYFFEKALLLNKESQDENGQIINYNNLGDIYRKTGDYTLGLIYTDSALQLAEHNQLNYQLRSAHRDYSKAYYQQGDAQNAYIHLEKAYYLYSELLNEENIKRIALLQTVYETERKENQIALLEKDKRLNAYFRNGMMMIFLVLAIIFFLVVRGQRLKMKQNRKIIRQKTQLLSKQEEISALKLKHVLLSEEKLKSELETKKFTESELEKRIQLKSQLITSHSLQIIRKNNFLEELKLQLQKIKISEKRDRILLINSLMKSINHDIRKDENWNDFNTIFSQVHKGFFENLQQQYPSISPSELRLCSLLKLNLQSDDMATILGVSNDSLRIARYRLRKKLDMNKNEHLVSFLMNI